MSKMGNFVMEIEEALCDGATAAEVADQYGLSLAAVEEIVARLEESYMEDDGQPSMYEEYQDLYGGDDAFETSSYCEDF